MEFSIKDDAAYFENIIRQILMGIGEDPDRDGLLETPKRVVKSWDELFSGYTKNVEDVFKVFEADGQDEMVVLKDSEIFSNCVTGDTQIYMPGGSRRIKDIIGQEPWVYTWDEQENQFTIKRAFDIRKTQENAKVYRVVFCDGSSINATSNHKFLLLDGSWKELKDLKTYDRLKSLRISLDSQELLLNRYCQSDNKKSWVRESRFIWGMINNKFNLPWKGYVIHHINGNHFDNRPENLMRLNYVEHAKIHYANLSEEQKLKRVKKARAGHESLKTKNFEKYQELKNKQRKGILKFYQTEKGLELRKKKVSQAKAQWEKRKLEQGLLNHKVLYIEFLGEENVYNMEVEDTHNYVANGVVIHNCEHHMQPFFGKVHIAYIPDGKVIGISKLARLADIYAHRLQIQERLTKQITDALMQYLKPKGAACVIEAQHLCMKMRGVNKQNSIMLTSSLTGCFKQPEVRSEFFRLIGK